MSWLALAAVVGLVGVHLFVGQLRFLEGTPRSWWLSIAGGAGGLPARSPAGADCC